MSRFAKLFAANAIAAAGLCSAAVALSSTAAAEPAIPPAVPGVPALNMIQEFATNPASMGAVLQTAATALNGASELVGGPAASTLPVSPIGGVPAAPAPAAPAVPAAAPAGPVSAIAPLLNQFGFPANLIGLGPSAGVPFPNQLGDTTGISPVTPAVPLTPPIATAPAVPAAPAGPAVNPLPLLTALP